jgi:transposase
VLTLSLSERDRLAVVRQVAEGLWTVAEGARRYGVGIRQMRRVMRRFERHGDAVVVHGLRGRPSNRRLPAELRAAALGKAREELYRDFGPTLLGEHLARDPAIGVVVHPATVRRWLIEAGLWQARPPKKRHRKRRERRAAYGEMVLMDTSIHDWLEGRSEEEMVLIALIDDATSRLYCRFFPRDTGVANRHLLVEYLERFGRMGAVYADGAGHFRVNFRSKERREADQEEALTLIKRALTALDIELIIALSPQAKGRVERLFGTLQDRLIKEMRVGGIDSMEAANRFLEEVFVPFWNERFTVEPAAAADMHRPLYEDVDLQRLFAETEERVVRCDFTFRYKKQWYQIGKEAAEAGMPKTKVTIELRLDGQVRFRWRGSYLEPVPITARPTPVKEKPATPASPVPLTPKGRPIPADHPWRLRPIVVGKARRRALTPVASRARGASAFADSSEEKARTST